MVFEFVEAASPVTKRAYKALLPDLRLHLINAQYDLRERDFPVIIVLSGNDRVGCSELLGLLNHILDGRYMLINALGRPGPKEFGRPLLWRYWRTLPRRGQIGVFLGAWPLGAVADRVGGVLDDAGLDRRTTDLRGFEEHLVADGALLLKYWLHLPKPAFEKRLKEAKKDPVEAWRISQADWHAYDVYDDAIAAAETVVRETDHPATTWQLIDSTNERYRNTTVARSILEALTRRLEEATPAPPAPAHRATPAPSSALASVDLTLALPKRTYRRRRNRLQSKLRRLSDRAAMGGVSTVLVFEGWDAAGKGGIIRRATAAITPENFRVVPIGPPSEEELAYPYLWRFWRQLPRAGGVTVFDRSWYGRVLVERVESLASEPDWNRAYSEINDFEAQLCDSGIVLAKFWLHIDPDEQLRRFKAREATPYKKYKLTDEDYRNRDRWALYEEAVQDMVEHTSTDYGPWHLVPANDKRWARVEVLERVVERLEQAL